MDEAGTLGATPVPLKSFWDRLAPLTILSFQVIVLLTLIVAAVSAVAWFRQPYLGFFVDPGMVIGNVQEPHYDWEQQSVLQGVSRQDVLVAVDGQEVPDRDSLQQVLRARRVGDQVELLVRARSGHMSTRTVTLSKFSGYEQMMYFWLPLGVAIVFLSAGFWAVRMRMNDPAARTFGVLTASIAFVLGGWFDVWSTQVMVLFWLVGVGIAAGAMFRFALIFPRVLSFLRRYQFVSWAGYLVGGGLAAIAINALEDTANSFSLSQSWQMLIGFAAFSFLFYYAGTVYRRFTSPSPVELEQTRLALWGSGLAVLPMLVYLLANYFEVAALEIPLIIGFIPLVLFPVTIGYALIRYRVVNTDFLISRALLYALLTVMAGAGYAFLISGVSVLFSDVITMNSPFLIGVVVFILALLINPFRNQVQSLLDGIFFQGEDVYKQTIQAFSNQLTQKVELSEITGMLRQTIREHFDPVRLHIYVYDNLVDRYVPTLDEEERPTTDIRFPRKSGLVHTLSHRRTTLFMDAREPLPPELENERPRLALLGAQLFLALPGQEMLSGWLAIGPPTSGENYTTQDMDFLTEIANHAATAIERAQVMVDKDRRVHEMNVLTRVAQGVNITVLFDDILELLYAQTRQVIPFNDFNLTLYNREVNFLRHVFLVQDDDRITEMENEIIPLGYGLERDVLENRRPIIADDYQQECRVRRVIPNKKGMYAWMGVPLNAGAEVIGVISIGSYNPAILYTEDQYNILQAIADQAAGAIVKARLLEETETRARQLASLNEVTRSLTSTLDLDLLLENVMTSAVEILNCEAGSLLLLDETTDELVFEVVVGPVAEQLVGERQPIGSGLAGKAAESMEPLIVNNVEDSADWDSEPDRETGFVTRGMLVVPMHYKDQVIGVLEVINKKNGMPFTVDDQELLSAFAGQAAVAVENVRLYMQTDQELANRVEELSIMQRLDRELNTSLEIGRAMEITLTWAMRQSNSVAGLVGVVTEDGLQVMASQGFDRQLLEYPGEIIPLDLPVLAEVVGEGRLVQLTGGSLAESALLEDASSQLVVPIRREVAVIGVILLESTEQSQYDADAIDFITRLCDHASIAISNAQLYSEVRRANTAKSDFVSFVSHELKTPMTSIRGYADLLAAGSVGEVNEAQADFLGTIRSNIQRMSTLVSDLADISRIEAGRLHLEFAPVSLNDVADEVVRSTRALTEEKDHRIEISLPEDLPLVWGDRNRLVQILTNLTSNAIKYTSNGGMITIRGELTANRWDPDGAPQVVHVEVIDNGMGIKLEDQPKIFTQYFRTDEGKETAPGTGLGLNITHYLVEMQGGKIWFESEYGSGSTFQFTVPVAEEEGA
jgi:signal transduction histidine kinase